MCLNKNLFIKAAKWKEKNETEMEGENAAVRCLDK